MLKRLNPFMMRAVFQETIEGQVTLANLDHLKGRELRARCRHKGKAQRLAALVEAGFDPRERLLKL